MYASKKEPPRKKMEAETAQLSLGGSYLDRTGAEGVVW
jgi:hypothetical protein